MSNFVNLIRTSTVIGLLTVAMAIVYSDARFNVFSGAIRCPAREGICIILDFFYVIICKVFHIPNVTVM